MYSSAWSCYDMVYICIYPASPKTNICALVVGNLCPKHLKDHSLLGLDLPGFTYLLIYVWHTHTMSTYMYISRSYEIEMLFQKSDAHGHHSSSWNWENKVPLDYSHHSALLSAFPILSRIFGGDELKRGREQNGVARSFDILSIAKFCYSTQLVLGRTLRLHAVTNQPFRHENGCMHFHTRNEWFFSFVSHIEVATSFSKKVSWNTAMNGKSLQLPSLESSRLATDQIKILASLVVSTFARIGMILKELDFGRF